MKHLIFILLITPTLLFSQGWEKTYNVHFIDAGYSLQQTTDGGYIIAGYAGGHQYLESQAVLLIKTDSDGDTLWTNTFGRGGGNSVQQCTDGGYIITGVVGVGLDFDVYLIKTDSNGDTLWTNTFGGVEHDWGNSVQQCTDGGYIIAGYTESFGNGSLHVYLIKTDSNGDTLWTKTFGGGIGYSVQQCTNGGYIVSGYRNSEDDVYLIKTDSNGDTLWTKALGGGRGYSVQQCTDGGYIATGEINDKVYLFRTDPDGDIIWTETYGFFTAVGYSVQQTADGGYIIAGSTNSDVYLIKTDENGISTSITEVPNSNPSKKLIKVVDLSGKEIFKPKKNQAYIEIYDDGTAQKKIIIF